MWKDPIVEEIRAVREQIARECNYDLAEICARLRRNQDAHAGRLVRKEDIARRARADPPPDSEHKVAAAPVPAGGDR